MDRSHLLIFGPGYAGAAIARAAVAAGFAVTATSRGAPNLPTGVALLRFGEALPRGITHALSTASPDATGDPVLPVYGDALAAASGLRWIGYLSTTGVYGDRQGGWVDETTKVAPGSARSRRRVDAERRWAGFADHIAVDLFRVAGIYGPGRSAFDDLRAGRARRIIRPGHCFGRIHRDDIAGAVLAAMRQASAPRVRTLHLADDEPAESAVVIEEAARQLGVAPPPAIPYDAAEMSAMARSFWAENRKVAGAITQKALGYRWRYPSYREGLAAILGEEGRDGAAEHVEVGRA